ncbi:MAG: hypothetical protein ACI9JL_000698 [Paracoccaceae bacterium]|jgi:hypothetical protein
MKLGTIESVSFTDVFGWQGFRNGWKATYPHYDFSDEVLPLGGSYWARLVETRLAG